MKPTLRLLLVALLAADLGAAATAAPNQPQPPVAAGPPGTAPLVPADLERQLDLSKTESWLFTVAHVDGAPVRAYRDPVRRVTCYFWKNALSCVKE